MPKLSELSLKDRDKLFQKLRVEITHHSNRIEGTTLNYGETKRLLEKGITANGKPLSEQLIILGFASAYDEILRSGFTKRTLTADFIKDLHALMFNKAYDVCPEKLNTTIGAYRTDERAIKGVNVKLSLPHKIKTDLENLLYQDEPTKIEEIADFHIKFEKIHPFGDGNGRIGRLLMAMQFIRNDMIPPLIKFDDREEYIKSMSDKEALTNLLNKCQQESYKFIYNNTTDIQL
ncbi:cell filamentation protein Fic [Campylobacter blaseri]|uniref:Cell filamentation protein Fic n=1 Tax=Campylobacter blaseri TaxID=2042961 RepID=A0A2P8R2S4_9BACT|nr:cell filamentation protein Fic [Campylobacter blaseri]PSM54437.1 cell filamentation protein Fic [Campylobacter blaseri]